MKIYYFDEKGLFSYEDDAELDPAEWQINHKKVYMDKILSPILSDEEIQIFFSPY